MFDGRQTSLPAKKNVLQHNFQDLRGDKLFTRGQQMLSPGATWSLITAQPNSALVNMADAKFDAFPLDLVVFEFLRSRMPGLRSSQERCVVWSLFGSMVPANATFALGGAAILPGNRDRDVDFVLYGPLTKVPSSPSEYMEQRHLNILGFYFHQLVGKHLIDGLDPFEGVLLLWTLAQASLDYPAFDPQLVLRAHTTDARRRQPAMVMLANKDAKGKRHDELTVKSLRLQQCRDGLVMRKIKHLTDPDAGWEWALFMSPQGKYSTLDDEAMLGDPKARSIEETWPNGVLIPNVGVGFVLESNSPEGACLFQVPIINNTPVFWGFKVRYQINGDELGGKVNHYRGLGTANAAFEHVCVPDGDGNPDSYTLELSLKLLSDATFKQGQVLVDYGASFGDLPTLDHSSESIFSDPRQKNPLTSTYWEHSFAKHSQAFLDRPEIEPLNLDDDDSDKADDDDAGAEEKPLEDVLDDAQEGTAAAQAPKRKTRGKSKDKKAKSKGVLSDGGASEEEGSEYEGDSPTSPPKKKARSTPLSDEEIIQTKKAARTVGRRDFVDDKKEFYAEVRKVLGFNLNRPRKSICKKIFKMYREKDACDDSNISGLDRDDSDALELEESPVHILHIFFFCRDLILLY